MPSTTEDGAERRASREGPNRTAAKAPLKTNPQDSRRAAPPPPPAPAPLRRPARVRRATGMSSRLVRRGATARATALMQSCDDRKGGRQTRSTAKVPAVVASPQQSSGVRLRCFELPSSVVVLLGPAPLKYSPKPVFRLGCSSENSTMPSLVEVRSPSAWWMSSTSQTRSLTARSAT